MAGEAAAPARLRPRLMEWLEVLAKLLGASAVLLVALFANSLQSKITGVSIQSQREQAESQLRASMFNSLISPIVGSQAPDKPMAADREVLLTELLALNFSENFEMKPLMEDANKRLSAENNLKSSKNDGVDPRENLWTIARRISERQKSTVAREWTASKGSQSSGWLGLGSLAPSWVSSADSTTHECEAYFVNLSQEMDHHDEAVTPNPDCQVAATFGDIVDLKSPDGNYTLRMVLVHPDWDNQTVNVSAQPFLAKQTAPKATDTQYKFTLTWLDLPLTDNTILSDGNRFAMYLRQFYKGSDSGTVSVTVLWFPKGYFTPRERPLNYNEVQDLLGTHQK